MRTIRVIGKGKLKLHPDTTRIDVTLEGVRNEYKKAVKRSAEDTEALKALLSGLGLERSEIKTANFSITPEYSFTQEKDNPFARTLSGFRYRHMLKAEFASDAELLGRILEALSRSPLKPDFGVLFTVKDREAAKKALLADAVKDAMGKAEAMTGAGGVQLGAIQSIDYSWSEYDFDLRPLEYCKKSFDLPESVPEVSSRRPEIEPEDINITDTVTIVWEIL